jgi:hypothetical protein
MQFAAKRSLYFSEFNFAFAHIYLAEFSKLSENHKQRRLSDQAEFGLRQRERALNWRPPKIPYMKVSYRRAVYVTVYCMCSRRSESKTFILCGKKYSKYIHLCID